MKRIICLSLCVLIVFTSVCFADQDNKISTGASIYYQFPTDIMSLISGSRSTPIEGELISSNKSVQRVSASDSTGFKSVVLSLLGDYETTITDYTYQSSNGYTSHSIQIERDWSWICSACILGLVLFCVFRIIGGIIC